MLEVGGGRVGDPSVWKHGETIHHQAESGDTGGELRKLALGVLGSEPMSEALQWRNLSATEGVRRSEGGEEGSWQLEAVHEVDTSFARAMVFSELLFTRNTANKVWNS